MNHTIICAFVLLLVVHCAVSFKLDVVAAIKQIIAEEGESKGKCAYVVRKAVQRGRKKPEVGTGIVAACNYGPWLMANGYKLSSKSANDVNVGDIAVYRVLFLIYIERHFRRIKRLYIVIHLSVYSIVFVFSFECTTKHPYGHIQVYCGDAWRSDFVQKNFSPYSDRPAYKIYT